MISESIFREERNCCSTELGGREIWSIDQGRLTDKNSFVDLTNCSSTAQAVLTSICGPEISFKMMKILRNSKPKLYSDEIPVAELAILEHIKSLNSSSYYIYVFGLARNPNSILKAADHVFLIIQYLDEVGKTQYRLLQSFLDHCDLKTDLDKESNTFSQD